MIGFFRKLISRRIVAEIDITICWTDVGTKTNATYCLTETIFGGRSWFLAGSVFPAGEKSHHRFAGVMLWVKNGKLAPYARRVGGEQ